MQKSTLRIYYLLSIFQLVNYSTNCQTMNLSRNTTDSELFSVYTKVFMLNNTNNTTSNHEQASSTVMNKIDEVKSLPNKMPSTKMDIRRYYGLKHRDSSVRETTTTTTLKPLTKTSTCSIELLTTDVCQYFTPNCTFIERRTSDTFVALFYSNCSSKIESNFSILVDESTDANCSTQVINSNKMNYKSLINVTCTDIRNKAGQDITLSIIPKTFISKIFSNFTTKLTLEPSNLSTITISSETDVNDTRLLSIFVPNCTDISNLEDIVVQCDDSDEWNQTLTDNCTVACFNRNPGTTYNFILHREAIPIIDRQSCSTDTCFQTETRRIPYSTPLDTVKNLMFIDDMNKPTVALFNFTRPMGDFDTISLTCSPRDRICIGDNTSLVNSTGNCAECNVIMISPIIRGVRYECTATTIKENFLNAASEMYNFTTDLEPVVFERIGQDWLIPTSDFFLNVSASSDFSSLQSICEVNTMHKPCKDLNITSNACSKALFHKGTHGCRYNCTFITQKPGYSNVDSIDYTIDILPAKPILNVTQRTSKSITVEWYFNEPTYIESLILRVNGTIERVLKKDDTPYTWDGLWPNRRYEFRLLVNTSRLSSSDDVFGHTAQAAPTPPSDIDIEKKIIPLVNHSESQIERYAISFSNSLFSNDTGIIRLYEIYVRRNQELNTSTPNTVGTYLAAQHNASIDYLAVRITEPMTRIFSPESEQKILLVLGNETSCINDTNQNSPCNKKLIAHTKYKIIVGACTNPSCDNSYCPNNLESKDLACTYVLSKQFETKAVTVSSNNGQKSFFWILAIPGAFVLLLTIFIGYRKYNSREKIPKSETDLEFIPLDRINRPMRPRPLIYFLNLQEADEQSIFEEYNTLDARSPHYHPSDDNQPFSDCDRYKNIHARGPWDHTAIYLTGRNRSHDYINANQILSIDGKKSYIATQGPLRTTTQDFWDMILQYRVRQIIVLTQIEEAHRSQCYPYFPVSQNEQFRLDNTVIRVNDIEYYNDKHLEIRYLLVKQGSTKHDVVHYYYTGWPDHGVIEPAALLDLIEDINQHSHLPCSGYRTTTDSLLAPQTVIHCSAGAGRTGTYIAVDTILRLLDCSDDELETFNLDIMAIVHHLRQQRVKMVQTKEQYLLIFGCVQEYLRVTRRLEFILHRSIRYENQDDSPEKPNSRYANISGQSSDAARRSSISRSASIVSSTQFAARSNRSSTTASVRSSHNNSQPSSSRKNSTTSSIQHQYHVNTVNHNEDEDSGEPPIVPPRRNTSTKSSVKSQQIRNATISS